MYKVSKKQPTSFYLVKVILLRIKSMLYMCYMIYIDIFYIFGRNISRMFFTQEAFLYNSLIIVMAKLILIETVVYNIYRNSQLYYI